MRGPKFYTLKLWVSSKVPPKKYNYQCFFWRGLISLKILRASPSFENLVSQPLFSAEGLDGTAKDLQRKGSLGLGIVRPQRWEEYGEISGFLLGEMVKKTPTNWSFPSSKSSALRILCSWATRDQPKTSYSPPDAHWVCAFFLSVIFDRCGWCRGRWGGRCSGGNPGTGFMYTHPKN